MMKKQGIKLLLTIGLVVFALFALPNQSWAPKPVDGDNDGFNTNQDCNDNDPNIYPGAPEVCNDGIDNNCDGVVDENCPAAQCEDADNDRYFATAGCGTSVDCNDNDSSIKPAASEEACQDGADNDCDGQIDEADSDCQECVDNDNDLFLVGVNCASAPDCDDNNQLINPGAVEDCTDNLDNDCDGLIDTADSDCAGGVADTDGDHFSNAQEIQGIPLSPGLQTWSGDTVVSTDPDTFTAFVIVQLANPSNIDHQIEHYFQFLTDPAYLGWDIVVLQRTTSGTSRIITPDSDQMAVELREDLDLDGIKWGISQFDSRQVPLKGIGTILSQRIVRDNNGDCAQNTATSWWCQDVPSGSTFLSGELTFWTIAWTMCHEFLHVWGVDPSGVGYHLFTPENIMLPDVTVTIKGGRVKYYTPTAVADVTIQQLGSN